MDLVTFAYYVGSYMRLHDDVKPTNPYIDSRRRKDWEDGWNDEDAFLRQNPRETC